MRGQLLTAESLLVDKWDEYESALLGDKDDE